MIRANSVLVFRPNSDDRRHAPGAVSVAAVGIEELRAAGSAEIECGDTARGEPRAMELVFCHGNQVKMQSGLWIGAVPGRLRSQNGEESYFATGG